MEHTPEIQAQQENLQVAQEQIDTTPEVFGAAFGKLTEALVAQGEAERTDFIRQNALERSQNCEEADSDEKQQIESSQQRCRELLERTGFIEGLPDGLEPMPELVDFWKSEWNGIALRRAVRQGWTSTQQTASNQAIEAKEAILRKAVQSKQAEVTAIVESLVPTSIDLDDLITKQVSELIRTCDNSTTSLIRTCLDELGSLVTLLENSEFELTDELARIEQDLLLLIQTLNQPQPSQSTNVHSLAAARSRRQQR